jgi:hypothetical protein
MLTPTLEPAQVIMVKDNLSNHKGQRVKELIKECGCELVYLTPYSLQTSVLSRRPSRKSRAFCERHKPEPEGAPLEARDTAVSAITAWDARGFFEHYCGYATTIQSL